MNPIDLYSLITTYLISGIPTFIFLIMLVAYLIGYNEHVTILQRDKNERFTIKKYKNSSNYTFFKFINKIIDWSITGFLYLSMKSYLIVKNKLAKTSSIIPDYIIENFLNKIFFNKNKLESSSFKSRVEFAKNEFNEAENNFWWHRQRAPGFRHISPIICGKWFNGKEVKRYIPMFVEKSDYLEIFKKAISVFIVSLIVSCFVFKATDNLIGFKGNTQQETLIAKVMQTESNFTATDTQDTKFEKSYELVKNENGYSGWIASSLLLNGYLTPLLAALMIALYFIEKSYYVNLARLNIPYIQNSQEEALWNLKDINTQKRIWSSQNLKSIGFDNKSPMVSGFISTGNFEQMNILNTWRKGVKVWQGIFDMAQGVTIFGSNGGGKTLMVLMKLCINLMKLKNVNLSKEIEYAKYFDTRTDTLTDYAVEQGYLDTYKPLPVPPVSISIQIYDIKAQLWKEIMEVAEKMHLQDFFLIIGARPGQISVDIMKGLVPEKFKAMLKAVTSQMGAELEEDFWNGSALDYIKRFADVIFLYSRTTHAREYMREHNIKTWSAYFIQEMCVFDPEQDLLMSTIKAIAYDLKHHKERLTDVFTIDKVRSIKTLMNDWQTMPDDVKGSLKAIITKFMNGFENPELSSFMTGIPKEGSQTIEVKEMWGQVTAFDLDIGKYLNVGKFVTLFLKTMVFEESINRQMRYSTKIAQTARLFREYYPSQLTVRSAIELIPVMWLGEKTKVTYMEYLKICDELMPKDNEWIPGDYEHQLSKISKEYPGDIGENKGNKARNAIGLARMIADLEPRHAQEYVGMHEFNPEILNKEVGDTEEDTKHKQKFMRMYHEYTDALTRVSRELMIFMGDEYQELITVDKSGGCISDFNLPPICRSARFIYVTATQTVASYVLKVGKEMTDVFIGQLRNKIILSSEDKATIDLVRELAGKEAVFKNPLNRSFLKVNNIETSHVIYDSFNFKISTLVENNKTGTANSGYPYCEDIFLNVEPLKLSKTNLDISNLFSGSFNKYLEFKMPDMKEHFLNLDSLEPFSKSGTTGEKKQSNANDIKKMWDDAHAKSQESYKAFIKDNLREDAEVMTDNDYTKQGNIHAYINFQIAGATMHDQVIIADDDFYNQDKLNAKFSHIV